MDVSKCISNWGEFSEHEYTSKPICDYCGQISEMLAIVQNEDFRTALEQIQELHNPVKGWISEREYLLYCADCGDATYPCATRRLADQGLGDNLARTTKNGENN